MSSKRSEKNVHSFHRGDRPTFRPCAACAASRKVPILCKGCAHNRDVINKLDERVRVLVLELKAPDVRLAKVALQGVQDGVRTMLEWVEGPGPRSGTESRQARWGTEPDTDD